MQGMFACPRGGPYHKAFEAAPGEKFPLVKVNPLQARRFAEAHGTRAKTDAVRYRQIAAQSVGRQVNACIHRQAPAG